jgi:D-aminoacyl-tRNA deacylase
VDGRTIGEIGKGFCCWWASRTLTTEEQVLWMADKVAGLRLFPDAEDKMNLGLEEVGGEVLVVSQFTLYGDGGEGAASELRGCRASRGGDSAL